jgi:hypothetical protein
MEALEVAVQGLQQVALVLLHLVRDSQEVLLQVFLKLATEVALVVWVEMEQLHLLDSQVAELA